MVYLTTKAHYESDVGKSNRLTAVLEVTKMHRSHEVAAEWFDREGLPLPPNCVVDRNPGLAASACIPCSSDTRDAAEARYRTRAEAYSTYFVCRPLWLKLDSPPAVTDAILMSALGQIPIVRTPTTWEREQVESLLNQVVPGDVALPRL